MNFPKTNLRVALLLSGLITFCLPLSAADYFWVGGSGNWSDISHWATTSGGNTGHSQAPTSEDDVFFDANSFTAAGQVVTFNTDINFCRNLSFLGATNNPTLRSAENVTLNVYGGFTLIAGMTMDYSGQMVFTGDLPDNSIDFANHAAGQTITFAGTASWRLDGAVTVDSTFTLTEGTLQTNGQAVTCGYLRSDGNANRTLDLGASLITVVKSTYRPYEFSPIELQWHPLWLDARNLTILPGTSRIELLGTRLDLFFEGPGTIDLNELVLAAPTGDAILEAWINYNGFDSEPDINVNYLDLRHRTDVQTEFSAGTLELHPGQEYTFESNLTYTLDDLVATGDCRAGIDLMASDNGSPATFASAGNITVAFVSLQSIAATGGGSFTANDAVDFGNNTGWTINIKPSKTFYWIGNTGDWSNPMNWSETSGGPAAGCVPSVVDDVFFDANSFSGPGQVVTLNRENSYCRSMNWTGATGNPELAGPEEHQLRISGSLTFIPDMDHSFEGNYNFSSNTLGNTITSAGQHFNQGTSFSGGGEWTLQDSLYVYRDIRVSSGIFRTNDQAIEAQFFRSQEGGVREIYFGNSYITLESRNDLFYYCELNFYANNLTFDAGTSTIELTGGNSGGVYVNGTNPTPLAFNVVIFTCPFGRMYNNLYDQNTGASVDMFSDSVLYYNSGSLGGFNNINYCYFSPGRTYELGNNSTQTIQELDANGSCDEGMVGIVADYFLNSANLSLAPGQSFERLFLRGVNVTGGAPAMAVNSIDAGNNSGWDFTDAASRTLYWVGGDGEWFDRAHWSLSSGGPGGECIPTAVDDVFIDQNSGTDTDLFIQDFSDRSVYAHDLSFLGTSFNVHFQVAITRLTGSLLNQTDLQYNTSPTYLYGAGEQTIDVDGTNLNQLVFENEGRYTFTSNVGMYEMNHQRGDVAFADVRVEAQRFVFVNSNEPKTIDLGASYILLTGEYSGFWEALSVYDNANLTWLPGTSTLDFTAFGGAIRAESPVELYDVVFSNPAGRGYIFSEYTDQEEFLANSVTYFGNGEHELEVTTNDLIFAPGKAYVFAADKTQTINRYWQTIGNNCVPISLSSSVLGTQANASVPAEGEILADFIQMRNITGVGGANFLAGSRSTDIANSNVNWLFETAPQFQDVGFLGEDRALCEGDPVTLNAFNFSPGESYLWSDGSTDTTFSTNQSGTYFVEVTFETACVIRDTVVILDVQDFEVELGADATICEGESFTLRADVGLNNADYRWQDGSTMDSLIATTTGQYFVTVDLGGCEKTDTFNLVVTPLPTIDLDEALTVCSGDDFTLVPAITAENFVWQDGSTDPTFTGDTPGIYWVEATNGNCSVRDSITVTYLDAGSVNLGQDTVLCDVAQFVLDAGVLGVDSYTWQDGSGGQTFTANESGQYHVTIEVSGCTASDTINVVFIVNGGLMVAGNYQQCEGESFDLTAPVAADSYSWSTGLTGPNFTTDTSGTFELSVEIGVCTLTETFTVDFLAPPVVELGPDESFCAGTIVPLDAGQAGVWQDDSQQQVFQATESGTYRVEVSNAACSVADSINLTFLALPNVSLGDDQAGCEGDILTVSVVADPGALVWNDDSTDLSRTFTTSGTYNIALTDANGCVGRDTVALSFAAPPLLELGPDTTVCDNLPFSLQPALGEGVLSWPDGSTDPVFPVQFPGLIIASLDNSGCVSRDSVRVAHRECIFFQAYLPTGFSPNFDGVNDSFKPLFDDQLQITGYQFQVFGRWGELLFSTTDVEEAWDGSSRNKILGTGVFTYVVNVSYIDDRGPGSEVLAGQVTLLR